MDLIYYQGAKPNFGDDLNPYIWERVLNPSVFQRSMVLVGIGTILDARLITPTRTAGKRVVVMGAGAGYGPLPTLGESWRIGAVRGPLTSALIDRPGSEVTDGAALIASLAPEGRAPTKSNKILLMPHHFSLEGSRWSAIAARLGMTYVNPEWSTSEILKLYREAKLVVCEAMHGAIVADALRIPWISVFSSPIISRFKWLDWTLSLDMPLRSHEIPADSFWGNRRRAQAAADSLRYKHLELSGSYNASALISEALHLFRQDALTAQTMKPAVVKPPPAIRALAKSASRLLDQKHIRLSEDALASAMQAEPQLSADRVFSDRLEQLKDRVRQINGGSL